MSSLNASEAIAGEVQLVTEKSRALFTQGDWNRVLRFAAFKAGNQWIEDRLPVRWSPGWARNEGGYDGKGGRDRIPFYERGTWIKTAIGAHPYVVATKGIVRLKIIVPVGHALKPQTAKAFSTLTAADMRCVASAFGKAAAALIDDLASAAQVQTGNPVPTKLTMAASMLEQMAKLKGRNVKSGIGGEMREKLGMRSADLADQHGRIVSWNKNHRKWQLDLWRRRAGGAAGPTQSQITSGDTLSQNYLGHKKRRHAMHQAIYRGRKQVKKYYRQQLGI